jgi:tetratricopeptide (TPR) repeat protein
MIPEERGRWEEVEEAGSRLRREGKLEEAAALYRRSLRQHADNVVLLNGLGLVLLDAGRPGEAREAFELAIQRSPRTPALLFNLGNALKADGDPAGAIARYKEALSLGLDRAEVHNNLGVALQDADRWTEAFDAFTRALSRAPQYIPALANAGHALIQMGRPHEAVEILRRAVQLAPEYADGHWLLSHALLVTAQWPEGWDEYEWRWHRMAAVTYHRGRPESRWSGGEIANKRILLYAEQGIGDAVQFARYAPLVAARGATVNIECHHELVALLSGIEGVSAVSARGESDPVYDVACPLLSLPSVFRTTIETIPAQTPYIVPDARRVALWRHELEPYRKSLRVGIVWAGNANHANDRRRSVPVGHFARIVSVPGVQCFTLQKTDPAETRWDAHDTHRYIDWTQRLRDFADTAALISALDLVVTVDTAVAHVAGALGARVWMLVPSVPDWRWLLDRTDSPWYPSMRIFRQRAAGDWRPVIDEVNAELGRVSVSYR